MKLSSPDERQRAAIVPLHKNLPLIVHEVHFALRAGKNGMIRVLHRIKPDAGAGGILLLDKIHHFSVHHFIPRKRQIKGRVDRCEKIVVERIEMFHHY